MLARSLVWRAPLRFSSLVVRGLFGAITPEDMVETRGTSARREPPLSLHQAAANLRAATVGGGAAAVSHKHAAVLVPLFEKDGDIQVILTQRSAKMNSHAGEVCLPGGKREEQDASDVATALREAQEELGLDPACVQVVTTLPPVLSKHLLSVTPVLATVPSGLRLTPNPAEVSSVFSAPLAMFLETGHGYYNRDVEWEGLPYRLHFWNYKYRGSSYKIWGLTAGMLVVIAEKAFQRKAAFALHPPGAQPYTALAYESGRLVFRGARAAEAAASAAVEGTVVTEAEAEAALGEETEEGRELEGRVGE